MADGASGQFQIGRVVNDAWRSAQSVLPVLWPFIVGLVILPEVVFGLIAVLVHTDPKNMTNVESLGRVIGSFLGIAVGNAVIFASVNYLDGKSTSAREAMARGWQTYLPAWGVSILMGLGIVIGFVLLVVPGIFLTLAWCVSLPVLIMEPFAATKALGRSFRLTASYRLPIFGVWLILLVIYLVAIVLVGVAGFILGVLHLAPLIAVIVLPLLSGGIILAAGAVPASIYHELLRIKEGGGNAVADVFV